METSNLNGNNELSSVNYRNVQLLSDKEKSAFRKTFGEYVKNTKDDIKVESINLIIKNFYRMVESMELVSSVGAGDLKKASRMLELKTPSSIFKIGFEMAEFGSFDKWQKSKIEGLLKELRIFDRDAVLTQIQERYKVDTVKRIVTIAAPAPETAAETIV